MNLSYFASYKSNEDITTMRTLHGYNIRRILIVHGQFIFTNIKYITYNNIIIIRYKIMHDVIMKTKRFFEKTFAKMI